jgi:hypothetical protein
VQKYTTVIISNYGEIIKSNQSTFNVIQAPMGGEEEKEENDEDEIKKMNLTPEGDEEDEDEYEKED